MRRFLLALLALLASAGIAAAQQFNQPNCQHFGPYPFVQNGCLEANALNSALDMSAGPIPPQNSLGQGAKRYHFWVNTSTSPYRLMQCVAAAGCSASYNPLDWTTWGVYNTGTGQINLSASLLGPPSASTLGGVLGNTGTAGQFVTGVNPTTGALVFATPNIINVSGAGSMAAQNAGAVAITGGTIKGMPNPTDSGDVASKAYVDAVSTGLSIHTPVRLVATTALAANTYNNGTAGVGATLTKSSNGAISVDGVTPSVNDRILVTGEAAPANNGAYVVTAVGSGGAPYVLTRATDFDQAAEIVNGSYFFVTAGSANAASSWVLQVSGLTVVGTTALPFTQFAAAAAYTAAGGLTLAGSTFSVTDTAVTPGTYGSASQVPQVVVNQKGQVTGASNTTIAIPGSAVSSGTLPSGRMTGSYPGITGVGIQNDDVLMKSGRPWADVRAFGAVGDGVANDRPAIQATIDAMAAIPTGGIVYLPSGNYCSFTTLARGNVPVSVIGANSHTYINACGHDVTLWEDSGTNFQTMAHLSFLGYGLNSGEVAAANPVVRTNCTNCEFDDIFIQGGSIGLDLYGGGDTILHKVIINYVYGGALARVRSSGWWFDRVQLDQDWPTQFPGFGVDPTAWAATTVYATNAIVINVSGGTPVLLQARVGGTSGGAAPVNPIYFQDVTDGTVKWRRATGSIPYYGLQLDTGAYQNFLRYMDLDGPFTSSLALTNTLAGAGPGLTMASMNNFGAGYGTIINAQSGSGLQLVENTIGSCSGSSCPAIYLNPGWGSGAVITNNIIQQVGFGVLLGGGVNTTINANQIYGANNGGAPSAAIQVNAGVHQFIISNNILGQDSNLGGANSRPVVINAGASDYFNVTNNMCYGVTFLGVTDPCTTDGSTGVHKTISGNN